LYVLIVGLFIHYKPTVFIYINNKKTVLISTEIYIHTYHSRFIPERVAEVSQIFLRDTHVLPKLVSYEEDKTWQSSKHIAVLLQSISGVINLILLILYSPFTTSMAERERCCSFILSRTPHETRHKYSVKIKVHFHISGL
jgi:hypothetical protein